VGRAGRDAWKFIQELLTEGEAHDRMHGICATFGLTPGLAKALIHLSADDGIAMRDLAEHWSCDASYITAVIDGLEERGMAERRPSPHDRRVKAVALTAAGAAAKAEVLDRMWEPPKAFDALSGPEQRQLRDLLAKVAGADVRLVESRARSRVRNSG
jgi:MarR family transcriptional regulator, organic hydroperoxide resistance regulator